MSYHKLSNKFVAMAEAHRSWAGRSSAAVENMEYKGEHSRYSIAIDNRVKG